MADVGDFATAHPEFRLTLWAGPGSTDMVRVAQSDKARLVEQSHLKYPHDVHLKPNIRGPNGRVTLDCGSCHVPDASGRTFVPIDMNKDCLECHTLEFEPAVTKRQVPHGSVDDVMATMQEFYANLALKNVAVDTVDTGDIQPRHSAGVAARIVSDEQRQRALAFADRKGAAVAQDLFEKRVCIVCHDVVRNTGPGMAPGTFLWGIVPLHVPDTWMPKARFDHDKHTTFKCTDCHEGTPKSKTSGDVALPDIASCRICHAGSAPAKNKIVSTCVSCHGFHEPGHPPWNQRTALAIGGAVQAAANARPSDSGRAP